MQFVFVVYWYEKPLALRSAILSKTSINNNYHYYDTVQKFTAVIVNKISFSGDHAGSFLIKSNYGLVAWKRNFIIINTSTITIIITICFVIIVIIELLL